jgi:hypothetical protein
MAIQKDKQKISPNSDNPGCITISKRRCDTASVPGVKCVGGTPAARVLSDGGLVGTVCNSPCFRCCFVLNYTTHYTTYEELNVK